MQLLGALEAPLFALTARWPRRSLLAAAQLAMAATCLWAAAASSHWMLLAALLLYGPATGIACGTAQAALVDAAPRDGERTLSRWALYQSMGDLAAPLLLAGLALIGSGWRAAFVVAAAVALVQAVLVRGGPRLPQPAPSSLEEAAGPDRGGLRTAILWCGAGVLCTLMDEALVSFGALHLEALGATAVQRGDAERDRRARGRRTDSSAPGWDSPPPRRIRRVCGGLRRLHPHLLLTRLRGAPCIHLRACSSAASCGERAGLRGAARPLDAGEH